MDAAAAFQMYYLRAVDDFDIIAFLLRKVWNFSIIFELDFCIF